MHVNRWTDASEVTFFDTGMKSSKIAILMKSKFFKWVDLAFNNQRCFLRHQLHVICHYEFLGNVSEIELSLNFRIDWSRFCARKNVVPVNIFEESMSFYLRDSKTQIWVFLEHAFKKGFECRTEIFFEFEVLNHHHCFHLLKFFCFVREVTSDEIIEQTPKTPNIYFKTVFFAIDLFWSHKSQCSAKRIRALFIFEDFANPKISNFCVSI